jgi:TolB protein
LLAAALLAGVLPLLAPAAAAQDTTRRGVRIGLTYDPGTKPAVVVLPVTGAGGDSIRAIVQRDLDYGDRVTVITADWTASAGSQGATAGAPNYGLFAQLGAAAIVAAAPTATGVSVTLHDVGRRQAVNATEFAIRDAPNSPEWRLAVHGISDEVERWITGTAGVAQTRIAYVLGNRVRVVDSDGENDRAVSDPGTVLSPEWHPSGRQLAYGLLGPTGSQIVIRDLPTARSRVLAATPGGLNVTPTFSPDGSTIVYAHGDDNGTDLFVASATESGPGRRITIGRGTDNISPTFSPDGRRIAFTSGRSGHPEVYVMDADGTNVDLLTPFEFGDQYYRSNPDWSPDGRAIAFQSQIAGRFQVMTIGLRDRAVRQLTSEGINEDPSWAPDGRHLVFVSTRTGSRQLFVVDVESGRVRQLTRGAGGARLPSWSPALRVRRGGSGQ